VDDELEDDGKLEAYYCGGETFEDVPIDCIVIESEDPFCLALATIYR
jgi:hypothetical protein